MRASSLIGLAAAMIFAAATSAAAQQDSTQQKPALPPATAVAAPDTLPAPVIDESGKNVRIFLDKVEVLGSIAKPQALFIIPGNDPKVDGIQIDRSFFREIFRPMEKDRFPRGASKYPPGQIPW